MYIYFMSQRVVYSFVRFRSTLVQAGAHCWSNIRRSPGLGRRSRACVCTHVLQDDRNKPSHSNVHDYSTDSRTYTYKVRTRVRTRARTRVRTRTHTHVRTRVRVPESQGNAWWDTNHTSDVTRVFDTSLCRTRAWWRCDAPAVVLVCAGRSLTRRAVRCDTKKTRKNARNGVLVCALLQPKPPTHKPADLRYLAH